MSIMNEEINLIGYKKEDLGELISGEFSNSLILTFEIDLLFFEQTLLRNFLLAGSTNNIVLVDGKQHLKAQNDQANFINKDTSSYICQGVFSGSLFHPKAILLSGGFQSRLFIGSGNLTFNGLSRNKELFYKFSTENIYNHKVFLSFKHYIDGLIEKLEISEFLHQRINRVFDVSSLTGLDEGVGDTKFEFIHNLRKPILEQALDFLRGVKKIYAIAPFVDSNFETIHWLKDNVQDNLDLYLQIDYTNFNPKYFPNKITVLEYPLKRRNLHAKFILFEKDQTLDLLFGSPNLTRPALLEPCSRGNFETSVFIRDLDKSLLRYYLPDQKILVDPGDIKPIRFVDEPISNDIYIIESAHYLKDGTIKVKLRKDISNVRRIELSLNGDITPVDMKQDYIKQDKTILKRINITGNGPIKLTLLLNSVASNAVMVVNECSEISHINKIETKVLNALEPILTKESTNDLCFVLQMDGLIKINMETTIKISQRANEEDLSEKEEAESEIEIEKRTFYISEVELDYHAHRVTPTSDSLRGFLSEIFADFLKPLKTIERQKKNRILEPLKGRDLNKVKRVFRKRKQAFSESVRKKVRNGVEVLSGSEPDTENEFKQMYSSYSKFLGMTNLLIKGIYTKKTTLDEEVVQWGRLEIRDLLYPLSKMLATFWKVTAHYKEFLLEHIQRSRIHDLILLTLFDILLITRLLEEYEEDLNIEGKRDAIKYFYYLTTISMLKFLSSGEIFLDSLHENLNILSKTIFNVVLKKLCIKDVDLEKSLSVLVATAKNEKISYFEKEMIKELFEEPGLVVDQNPLTKAIRDILI